MKRILLAVPLILMAAPAALAADGVFVPLILSAKAALAGLIATTVVTGVVVKAVAQLDARAKLAEAKGAADRTMLDRLMIRADGAVDRNLNLAQLETFLTSFVMARLDVVLAPGLTQAEKADALLKEAVEAFPRRNPDLAKILPLPAEVMLEKLQGTIGKVLIGAPDALADSLRAAGVQGAVPPKG